MDQGTSPVKCDRCGRMSGEWQERTADTAWHHPGGRYAQPQRHLFKICRRCLRIREGGSDFGQIIFAVGLIAFGSWLLNFPAFVWRWPQTAPRGHGALGAQITLALTAVGIVIWASLSFKRWLRNAALDSLPAAEMPGWSPGTITPEKYDELVRGAEVSMADPGGPGTRTPLYPGRCGICEGALEDSSVRVVLRTGREIASRVTDVNRVGDSILTTNLKTFGDIEDYETRLCPGCWAGRRRKLRRATASFAIIFPLALIAALTGIIYGVKAPFLGLGLTALVLVAGLVFYVQMLKWLQSWQPMAILERRVMELRSRGKEAAAFKVVATTWPLPRKKYFE